MGHPSESRSVAENQADGRWAKFTPELPGGKRDRVGPDGVIPRYRDERPAQAGEYGWYRGVCDRFVPMEGWSVFLRP